jgi:hypothetical protein
MLSTPVCILWLILNKLVGNRNVIYNLSTGQIIAIYNFCHKSSIFESSKQSYDLLYCDLSMRYRIVGGKGYSTLKGVRVGRGSS